MANRFGDESPQTAGVSRFGDPVSRFGDAPVDAPDPYGQPPPVTGKRTSKEEAAPYVRPLPAGVNQPEQGNPIGRFLGGAINSAWGLAKGIGDTGSAALRGDPTPFVEAGKTAVDQFNKSKAAFGKGRVSEGLGHAGGAVPFVGPAAVHAGERMGGAPEMPPLQRLDSDPQTMADVKPPDVAGGAGEAAVLIAASGPRNTVAALRPIAKPLGAAIAKSAQPLEAPLRESALKSYERALGPTTKRNKFLSQEKVAPGLIDRGVIAATRKGLHTKATAQVNALGAAIDDAWTQLPEGEALPVKNIIDSLSKSAKENFTITEAGNTVDLGKQARMGMAHVRDLQRVIANAATKDPVTGEAVVSSENLRRIRQFSDTVAAKAGAYEGVSLADQSAAAAHELLGNAIREQLAQKYPDIAAINREFNFWKNTQKVVGDTLTRTRSQSTPMGEQIAAGGMGAAGLAMHGVSGALLTATGARLLIKFMRSPAWQTTSAVVKSRVADLLAEGKVPEAEAHIAGLLEAPPIRMPGVPDTSGPVGVKQPIVPDPARALPQPPPVFRGQKALPPPTIKTPPPADTSGPTGGRPYMGRGVSPDIGTRKLPPASRVQSGGFAVEDMVPVRNPETGQIEYVAPWTLQGLAPLKRLD